MNTAFIVIKNRAFASMSDVRGRDKDTEDSEKFFAGGSEHRLDDVCCKYVVATRWSFVVADSSLLVLQSRRNKSLPQICFKLRSSKDKIGLEECYRTDVCVCFVFYRAGARPLAEVKEKSESSFVGTGFRLGESEGPSRAVAGSSGRQPLKVSVGTKGLIFDISPSFTAER